MQLIVNVDVDDLERGVEFYTKALGLRLERRLFAGSVAEMTGASSKIYLMAKPAGSPPSPRAPSVRDYSRHWTPVHLDFEVDDVLAAVERAVAAGARLEGEIQSFSWGRQATLSDPFGHGFCVLQFSQQGYDAVARDGAQPARSNGEPDSAASRVSSSLRRGSAGICRRLESS